MLYGIVPILESNIGMLGIFANFFIVPMLGPNSVPIILIMGPNIVPLLDGCLGKEIVQNRTIFLMHILCNVIAYLIELIFV